MDGWIFGVALGICSAVVVCLELVVRRLNNTPIVTRWVETDDDGIAWLHTFTTYPGAAGGMEEYRRLDVIEAFQAAPVAVPDAGGSP